VLSVDKHSVSQPT